MFHRGFSRFPHQRMLQTKEFFAVYGKQIQFLRSCLAWNRKSLCRGQHTSVDKIIKDKTKEKGKKPQSLIAQKVFEFQSSTETEPDLDTKTRSTEDIHLKLKKLAKDFPSISHPYEANVNPISSNPINENPKEIEDDVIDYKDEEEFIEQIMFKHDLQNRPKPSPLLGTEDQTVPTSNIPCVGCGALLHCQHRTMPGFLPSERFKLLSESELKSTICQRCYYIQHCDAFVEVKTSPQDYAEIIAQIKPTRSVIVKVVDVMDIHGSIIPNLMTYIGQNHPLIIVGNKADLIAPDCPEYLKNMKEAMMKIFTEAGLENIRKVLLTSAKTGFGIEKLISLLLSLYKNKVDVFIIGTANAGKSSLFNTLLASDYCRQRARDLIQRATISVWPGTTLNLLKFPIMHPSERILSLRQKRLKQEKAIKKEQLKQEKEKKKQSKKQEKWELKEDITTTDLRTRAQIEKDSHGEPWGQEVVSYKGALSGSITPFTDTTQQPPEFFDQSLYSHTYWVYDTPGVINPDQTFNFLDPEECPHIQPMTMVSPRCIILKPGTTIFISGMARLDYVLGSEAMMVTVHCSSDLPIRMVHMDEADQYYLQHIGSADLGIPLGGRERLDRLPALVGKEIVVEGDDDKMAVADIQLSSIGWVSLAPRFGCLAKLRAYTPGRKGIHLRSPSLLPRFMQFKGKKISGTPFFWPKKVGSAMLGKPLPSDGNEF